MTVVYYSLERALRDGYTVYDRTENGYVVRMRTSAGWAMALVIIRPIGCDLLYAEDEE